MIERRPHLKKSEYGRLRDMSKDISVFDWTIVSGYIKVYPERMSIHHLFKGQWNTLSILDWKSKKVREINAILEDPGSWTTN